METIKKEYVMNSRDTICMVRNALNLVDKRLVDHGERVAFILREMLRDSTDYTEEEKVKISILGVFHDIGAYKTDEIDKMVQFETEDVLSHSIYGYLFLKYFSPLGEMSEAILYHHFAYAHYRVEDTGFADIALLINLADRIDVYMQLTGENFDFYDIEQMTELFDPHHFTLFRTADSKYAVVQRLRDGTYLQEVNALIRGTEFTNEEINQYLDMMVYSIDFRSAYTVTHTINTVAISVAIAEQLGYSREERIKIYYGALLHDIGKIAIPLEILEYPGKLSFQAMVIMKTHVNITEEILRGVVHDEICDIAVRHHEKLDGSGYPRGLHADELTESQRVLAVADIISALSGKRSYKEVFPKQKILSILAEMKVRGQLCPKICGLVETQYDTIIEHASSRCDSVLQLYSNLMVEYGQLKEKFVNRPDSTL